MTTSNLFLQVMYPDGWRTRRSVKTAEFASRGNDGRDRAEKYLLQQRDAWLRQPRQENLVFRVVPAEKAS